MENTHWGHEGNFKWHDLPNAGYSVHGRYKRDRFRHPMFVLENRATGEYYICQSGWSGGYAFEFELDTESADAHLGYKVMMSAPAPLRTISSNAAKWMESEIPRIIEEYRKVIYKQIVNSII